jgi:hypothetical protein
MAGNARLLSLASLGFVLIVDDTILKEGCILRVRVIILMGVDTSGLLSLLEQ